MFLTGFRNLKVKTNLFNNELTTCYMDSKVFHQEFLLMDISLKTKRATLLKYFANKSICFVFQAIIIFMPTLDWASLLDVGVL